MVVSSTSLKPIQGLISNTIKTMRITLVVLLCSVTAALAYPIDMLSDTETSDLAYQGLVAENDEDLPEYLRAYIMGTIKNRPRPTDKNTQRPTERNRQRPTERNRPRPDARRPIEDREHGRTKSRSESSSGSRSGSSSRRRMYESVAKQRQADLKSFKEYLARFMQQVAY